VVRGRDQFVLTGDLWAPHHGRCQEKDEYPTVQGGPMLLVVPIDLDGQKA